MTDYAADVKKYATGVDDAVVKKIVNHLGIALRNKDSSMVSCSDPNELARIRNGFCRKKLALTISDDKLDEAIAAVCEKMGSSNRNKSRVTFYYLLAENLGKLSVFS